MKPWVQGDYCVQANTGEEVKSGTGMSEGQGVGGSLHRRRQPLRPARPGCGHSSHPLPMTTHTGGLLLTAAER